MRTSCWYCNAEFEFSGEDTHDCPVKKHLTKEEAEVAAAAIISIEFCQHVHQYSDCCGMTENLCKAVHLIAELKRYDIQIGGQDAKVQGQAPQT